MLGRWIAMGKKKKNESDKEKKRDTRILETIQGLQQEVCSMKKLARKKKKRDKRILEAIQQEVCSMQERIEELEGKIAIQQQAQESPSVLPPPSTQTDESSTAKYKLVIKSVVSDKVYIGRPIGTTEGNGIKVAVEDFHHQNKVAAGHHLASVKVKLVVLDGNFYNESVRTWTKKEFEESIKRPNQKEMIKNAIFQLTDGEGVHEGTTINKSSNKSFVKLGVMVHEHSGERVLEGVSNSFKVLHCPRGTNNEEGSKRRRTQNSPKKNGSGTGTDTPMGQLDVTDEDGTPDTFRAPYTNNPPHSQPFPTSKQSNQAGLQAAPHDDKISCSISANSMVTGVGQDGNSAEIANIQEDAGLSIDTIWALLPDTTGGNHSSAALEQNQMSSSGDDLMANSPQCLAREIIAQIPSVRALVPPGNQQLLTKIQELEQILRYSFVQLQPQAQGRNFGALQCCQKVVGDTILQLTMDLTVILHHEGPAKNLFRDLQRLQQALVEMMARQLELFDLYEYRGNGTGDQNLHGYSHGNALSQNTAHGMQQGYSFPIEHDNASAAEEQRQIAYGPLNYGQGRIALGLPVFVPRPRLNHKVSDYPLYTRRSLPCPLLLPVDYDYHLQLMMGRLSINNYYVARTMMGISRPAIRKTPPKEIVVVEPESSVKQKSHALCGDNNKGITESFDHFVVVDLKATCEKGRNTIRQEIIEFSSILVDAITGQSMSTFHTYVRPIIHPELSEFCKEYNGILQTDVEAGVMLSEALQLHQDWLKEEETENGGHLSFAVVTWGDWDCRTMLKQECLFKQVAIPHYFHRWINLKKPFAEKFGGNYWLAPVLEAVQAAGLQWKGRPTGGESHADNKARLLELLMRQGAKLYITGNLPAM